MMKAYTTRVGAGAFPTELKDVSNVIRNSKRGFDLPVNLLVVRMIYLTVCCRSWETSCGPLGKSMGSLQDDRGGVAGSM